MTREYLTQVYEIEQDSFSAPWSMDALEQEIDNNLAYYLVAINENCEENEGNITSEQNKKPQTEIVGYIGMWHVINEGHITNIAVKREMRGKGIGNLLMQAATDLANRLEMIGLTLEVRVGNRAAMGLYNKHGFKMEGIRKNYYSDTREDAVIMWKYL